VVLLTKGQTLALWRDWCTAPSSNNCTWSRGNHTALPETGRQLHDITPESLLSSGERPNFVFVQGVGQNLVADRLRHDLMALSAPCIAAETSAVSAAARSVLASLQFAMHL